MNAVAAHVPTDTAATFARLDPLADSRWQAFVAAAPGASVFHHSSWLALLARRYRYPMSALCVYRAGSEQIVAGLPLAHVESRLTGRRLVAMPFSDVCPPLYARDAGEPDGRALADAISDERSRTGLDVEIRAPFEALAGGHAPARFLHHRLALEADADAVIARASKSQVRRGIAKAVREGLSAEPSTDRAALEEFYALHLRTRRRQGVPIQPKSFILAFEELFARGLGYVMIARRDARPIAAAVFLTFGSTLTYKYGASDERFLSHRPNHLMFAAAIRRGCAEGYTELDFGRTDPANAGLAAFKRSWGAREEPLAYTYLGRRAPTETTGPAQRLISAAIRRGPAVTGRAIGTALYRHVG